MSGSANLRFIERCFIELSSRNGEGMGATAVDELKKELGAAASRLPDLSRVPEAALKDLVQDVRAAKAHQRALLEQSAEHSLRLVPALLRPAVRKVLFG